MSLCCTTVVVGSVATAAASSPSSSASLLSRPSVRDYNRHAFISALASQPLILPRISPLTHAKRKPSLSPPPAQHHEQGYGEDFRESMNQLSTDAVRAMLSDDMKRMEDLRDKIYDLEVYFEKEKEADALPSVLVIRDMLDHREDDLQARYYMPASEVDQEITKAEEDGHFLDDSAEKTVCLQTEKQDRDNEMFSFGKMPGAAIAFTLAGLILCPQAWAGPEVASVQDAASWLGDLDDIKSGFVSAFLLIFFSEIGDKTFFIAAVLASRNSNAAVFTGTFGALAAMTFISVFLGRTFHYIDGILPFSLGENELPLDDLAAVVLLVYFGVSTLVEATSMEGSKAEEEQQEAELAIAGLGANGKGSAIANTALSTFALVFVAEWGDKSFFSTVALSAASSPLGVVSGAIAGHGTATLLAVLGGSFLSTYISEKVIAYIGGVLFLVFAAVTLIEIVS